MTAKEVLSFTIEDYYNQLPNKWRDDEIDVILNNWEELSGSYNPNLFDSLARKLTQFETISRTFVVENDLHKNDYVYRYKVKDKIFEVDLEYYYGMEDDGNYRFDLQSFREVINN
jgi:hypothetical protein